jgi:hypothetical protein
VQGFRVVNGTFYYVRYRHNGTQTVKSIGRQGPLTPDTARAKAKQLLGTVAGGTDPFAQALSGEGFPAAINRYLERKRSSLKPNSFRETVQDSDAPLLLVEVPLYEAEVGRKSATCPGAITAIGETPVFVRAQKRTTGKSKKLS